MLDKARCQLVDFKMHSEEVKMRQPVHTERGANPERTGGRAVAPGWHPTAQEPESRAAALGWHWIVRADGSGVREAVECARQWTPPTHWSTRP